MSAALETPVVPLSKSRPRRESAVKTEAAIQASLKEEAKAAKGGARSEEVDMPAPSSTAAGKRKAESSASKTPKESSKSKTPKTSEGFSVLKSGLPKSSKAALAKVDAADLAAINGAVLKKNLNTHVKSLAHTVDADWHDSYEETAEEACEWFSKCGDAVEACLRVGVGVGVAFDQCHEVLKLVTDTWDNINAIPFRGDVGEDVSNVDKSIELDLGGEGTATYGLTSPEGLCSLAWPFLLARAAADAAMPDEALLRMIKDAVDHGIDAPHQASEEEKEADLHADVVGAQIAAGRTRLASLFRDRKAEWSILASTKKKHKMRRAIDRRFDGPKHRRTRDYSDSDEGEDGCVVS